MSRCIYNGKRLIPCPLITLNKTFNRLDDGTLLGSTWEGTINGKIVTHMGSPNKNKVFWTLGGFPPDDTVTTDEKLGVIFRKQEAIRELFAEDGYLLEFQSLDGSAPMKCNPRITGITFAEGPWFNVCDYTITFEADTIYINGTVLGEDSNRFQVKSAGETWQIETNEDIVEYEGARTYRLTHEVNAQGKRIFNPDGSIGSGAWVRAKEYVTSKLGYDALMLSGSSVKDLPSYYNAYNHVRSENIDEAGGSYSVTETWFLSSGTATEDFSISCNSSLESSLLSVTIDGTITGLENRDADMVLISTKYSNALSKFNSVSGVLYSRAQNYAGRSLNYLPLQSTIGKSPNAGSITYSYQYNDRPSNLLTNSLSEIFTVQDSFDNDVIAIIPVPGRTRGPVLQNIETKTERTRNVNVEIVLPIPSGSLAERYAATPYSTISPLVDGLKPVGYQVFQTENSPSWDFTTGRFSLNRGWIYEEN